MRANINRKGFIKVFMVVIYFDIVRNGEITEDEYSLEFTEKKLGYLSPTKFKQRYYVILHAA